MESALALSDLPASALGASALGASALGASALVASLFLPKRAFTRAAASSSMLLMWLFTSIPLSFKNVITSLLETSSSFASSCIFIFAIFYLRNSFAVMN